MTLSTSKSRKNSTYSKSKDIDKYNVLKLTDLNLQLQNPQISIIAILQTSMSPLIISQNRGRVRGDSITNSNLKICVLKVFLVVANINE